MNPCPLKNIHIVPSNSLTNPFHKLPRESNYQFFSGHENPNGKVPPQPSHCDDPWLSLAQTNTDQHGLARISTDQHRFSTDLARISAQISTG